MWSGNYSIVVVDFEVSEVYHIYLLIPPLLISKSFVTLSMCKVGHDSVLKWHGSSKWSKCGDVWYYATLKVCHDKCKIQTLAGTGAHFIQETCPGHIAKQAARRHVPTNDTRWVSEVIWHVHTCTACWVCHFQNFDNLNHAKMVLCSFWICQSFFFFLILESLDGKLYLKA